MRSFFVTIVLSLAALATAATASSTTSVTTYAPIPSGAAGPPVSNNTGYRIEVFGQGAYMVTDGLYQAIFFVACDSVILVDAPPTIGYKLLRGIRSVTDLPVSHVVYSHAHADHIGAAYLFNQQNITFIAHTETLNELAQVNDTNRPTPTITFTSEYTLTVSNQTLHLSYKGPNHQPGNIFIYAPLQKILMLVDVVYPGWVPFDALGESQNIPGYIAAHDLLLGYDFTHYIGGHLDRSGTRDDVLIAQSYLKDLYNNCAEAIRLSGAPPNATNPLSVQTAFPPIQAVNPGNSWALFEFYVHDLVAGYCADRTTKKWLGRLAGADVYGLSNAVTMVESLRIDFGVLGPFGVVDA